MEGSPQDSPEEPAVRRLPPLPLSALFVLPGWAFSRGSGGGGGGREGIQNSWPGKRGILPPPHSLSNSLPLLFPRQANTHQRMHAQLCMLRAVPRSNGV